MFDLVLAVVHHILVFGLFGIVAAEYLMLRPGLDRMAVERIAAVDLWYGLLAGLIVVVGFARAIFAAKGGAYYADNVFFWLKIGSFVVIGLLSARPTIAFIRWKKGARLPGDGEVAAIRSYLRLQILLFAVLLAFAAAMARGYGGGLSG